MNFTEGFGKSWIDRILGKVDKDQGVANAGKVLGIGDDGQVKPVEQSGGSSGIPYIEVLSNANPADVITPDRVKAGDVFIGYINDARVPQPVSQMKNLHLNTEGNFKYVTGDLGASFSALNVIIGIYSVDTPNISVVGTVRDKWDKYENLTIDGTTVYILSRSTYSINRVNSGNLNVDNVISYTIGCQDGFIPRVIVNNSTTTITSMTGVLIHNS